MTSKQLYEENEVLTNSTYKLLKKYQAVRTIIKTLAVSEMHGIYDKCKIILSNDSQNVP